MDEQIQPAGKLVGSLGKALGRLFQALKLVGLPLTLLSSPSNFRRSLFCGWPAVEVLVPGRRFGFVFRFVPGRLPYLSGVLRAWCIA